MDKKISNKAIIFLCILVFLAGKQIKADTNQLINSFSIPEPWQNAVENVAARVTFPKLPESSLYRLGITVNENYLGDPQKASRVSGIVGESGYKDKQWIGGGVNFRTDYLVKNPESLPTELPAERKKSLIEKCREWGKTEAETEKYLANRLESHRKSKENLVKGHVDIRIVNAPSANAAFEYLIIIATVGKNISLESIISEFSETARINGLGTIGYRGGSHAYFIRDNIAVVIQTDGEFNKEVMDIAKKIDTALLKQPLLTYEQLQARCPKLHIGPGKKSTPKETPFLAYQVEAPEGVQAWMREMKVNGKARSVNAEGKIYLEEKPRKVKIEATLVSNELLAVPFETEIEMPTEE